MRERLVGIVVASCLASVIALACSGGGESSSGSSSSSSGASSSSSSSGSTSSSSTSTSSSSSSGDPCGGLGCASQPGHLEARVVDASTGASIPDVTFYEGGKEVQGRCTIANDGGGSTSHNLDAGVACEGFWYIDLGVGKHTVEARAKGFASQTFEVTLTGPSGCCGQGPTVEQTVKLTKA